MNMQRHKCFYCQDTGTFFSLQGNQLPCVRCKFPSSVLTKVPKQHNMAVNVGKPFVMLNLEGFRVVIDELAIEFLSDVANEGVY